jgi:hypothetical protein
LTPRERERARAIAAELKRRKKSADAPGWKAWLIARFPAYVGAGFAPRHAALWEWTWAIAKGVRPAPFVALWPRGGAKSTSAELAAAAVGMRQVRRYALYISETQDQADKHVATIAGLLESAGVDRAVNKYGNSKGWRRNRLRTADGFTVDALGLDTAARGIKVDADRPDLMVLDDIDARHDTVAAVQKKIETLTTTILPAGSNDCAVLAVQNLIHTGSVFTKLSLPPGDENAADFLSDRIISGPFPALDDFTYEIRGGQYVITGGAPTWAGQDVAACQGFIKTWGMRAFLRECQHDIGNAAGALWDREAMIDAHRVTAFPELVRIVVAVDPEATSGDDSAETGIVVAGRDAAGHGYVLDDATLRARPLGWATAAVAAYNKFSADRLVAEDNNGGEMVEETIRMVKGAPPVTRIHASRNKQARAEPIAAVYEQGLIHHVGFFSQLEDQMCGWAPGTGAPSPDRLDALVWAMTELGFALPILAPGAVAHANPAAPSRFHRGSGMAGQADGGRWGRGRRR